MPTQEKTNKKYVPVADVLEQLFKDYRASEHGRTFKVLGGVTGLRDLAQETYGHTLSQYSDRQLAIGMSRLVKRETVSRDATMVCEVSVWRITISEG